MRKKCCILFLFCFYLIQAKAQLPVYFPQYHIGYFAPFVTNSGISVGSSHVVYQMPSSENQPGANILAFTPEVSYYTQYNTNQSLLFNPGFSYGFRHHAKSNIFFFSAALGYLYTWQKYKSSIPLSNGKPKYFIAHEHYFLPNFQFNFQKQLKSNLGLFVKTTLGRQIRVKRSQNLFFAIGGGLYFSVLTSGKPKK